MTCARGQSAIEYLVTYGWMLLVVAVVGGAVYSFFPSACTSSVSGFSGADVRVEEFGVTDDGKMQLVMRNGAADQVEIDNVVFADVREPGVSTEVSVGSSNKMETQIVRAEDGGCSSVDLQFNYDVGGLEDLQTSGSVTGSFEVYTPFDEAPSCEDYPSAYDEGNGSSENPYEVSDVYDLQCMDGNLSSNFKIVDDIYASHTIDWNEGKGFEPIGNSSGFTGSLNGGNNEVKDLYIDRPGGFNQGLFHTLSGTIENIKVKNASINAESKIGALTGGTNGKIKNVTVEATLTTSSSTGGWGSRIGGVAGSNNGIIRDANADVDIEADDQYAGGITGTMKSDVYNSSATGSIDSDSNSVGGITGKIHGGGAKASEIINSSFDGDLVGTFHVGGVLGNCDNCQWGGGGDAVEHQFVLDDVYATGTVEATGTGPAGGLVGRFDSSNYEDHAVINTSYASVSVTGGTTGGIAGYSNGTIQNSYWDEDISGLSNAVENEGSGSDKINLQGLNTAEMQGESSETNMNELDFENTWKTVDGDYPRLWFE